MNHTQALFGLRKTTTLNNHFHYKEEIKERVNNLSTKKATAENDIPARSLNNTNDIVSFHLKGIFNDSIKTLILHIL